MKEAQDIPLIRSLARFAPPRMVLIGFALIFLVLCIPVVAKLVWNIPPADLLRDPAAVLGGPAYVGVISTLGLLLWGCTAALCLYTAAAQQNARGFWLFAGGVTLMLLADDWLLLHENAFPVYLGLSEYYLYGAYALAVAYYLIHFRQVLLRAEYWLLLIALGGFAASLGIDLIDGIIYVPGFYLFEDGAKLIGIASWLMFHARLSVSFITERDRWVDFAGAPRRQPRSQYARRKDDRNRRAPRPRVGGIQTE